jgi:hypothetical protein
MECSCYYQSCDKFSMLFVWLSSTAWEQMKSLRIYGSGFSIIHIAVEGHWTCVWLLLLFKLLQSFLCFLGLDLPSLFLFPVRWYVVWIWNAYNLFIRSFLNYIEVDLSHQYGEFQYLWTYFALGKIVGILTRLSWKLLYLLLWLGLV